MKLQRFQDVSDASDVDSFTNSLVKFAHYLDFEIASASLVIERPGRKAAVIGIGNHPEDFKEFEAPAEENIRRDPVIKMMKTKSVPFTYDQSVYVASGAGDLWEHQAPFGYKTGIAVALHLPGSMHFLLGMDRSSALPSEDDSLTQLLASLQLLAVYAQEPAVRLLRPLTGIEEVQRLTARELEILKLTADGKSAWVIGELLKISASTVNFHLANIYKKLDVSNKQQAIYAAMSMQLI